MPTEPPDDLGTLLIATALVGGVLILAIIIYFLIFGCGPCAL
jgi:hypothetical protein